MRTGRSKLFQIARFCAHPPLRNRYNLLKGKHICGHRLWPRPFVPHREMVWKWLRLQIRSPEVFNHGKGHGGVGFLCARECIDELACIIQSCIIQSLTQCSYAMTEESCAKCACSNMFSSSTLSLGLPRLCEREHQNSHLSFLVRAPSLSWLKPSSLENQNAVKSASFL